MYFENAVDVAAAIQSIQNDIRELKKSNVNEMQILNTTDLNTDANRTPSIWDSHNEQLTEGIHNESDIAILELKIYLSEPVLPKDSNPLHYWRDSNLHSLKQIAFKHLSVVATSVPSERLFSKTGIIMSKLRSNLEPKRLHKQVFLCSYDWEPNCLN